MLAVGERYCVALTKPRLERKPHQCRNTAITGDFLVALSGPKALFYYIDKIAATTLPIAEQTKIVGDSSTDVSVKAERSLDTVDADKGYGTVTVGDRKTVRELKWKQQKAVAG